MQLAKVESDSRDDGCRLVRARLGAPPAIVRPQDSMPRPCPVANHKAATINDTQMRMECFERRGGIAGAWRRGVRGAGTQDVLDDGLVVGGV